MKTEEHSAKFDKLKWLLIALLVALGIFIDIHFVGKGALMAIGLLLVAVVIGFVFFQTQPGSLFSKFVGESRVELRKVVWPTRKETIDVTRRVIMMIVVVAIVLCVVDEISSLAIEWIIG